MEDGSRQDRRRIREFKSRANKSTNKTVSDVPGVVVYVASATRLGSGCSPPKEEDLFYGFGKQTRRGLII